MIKEFKEFAIKGNVLDMAVGIIIGGAFGKIVTSFVNDVLMPPLGMLIGKVNFSDLKVVLSEATLGADGEILKPESAIMYGQFIQTIIDFLIVAWAIFLVLKALNNFKRKEEEKPAPPAPTPEDTLLLREIRDELKKGKE
jgi:large conductance mechanosensitive channel